MPYLDARDLAKTMGFTQDELDWYDREVQQAAAAFEERVSRAKGALPMLGTVTQGKAELVLGPFQAQVQPAAKRATEAIKIIVLGLRPDAADPEARVPVQSCIRINGSKQ